MKKLLLSLITALALVLYMSVPAFAATADVTVTATPSYVSITDNATTYDFGVVSESTNYTTSTALVAITNAVLVVFRQTIQSVLLLETGLVGLCGFTTIRVLRESTRLEWHLTMLLGE